MHTAGFSVVTRRSGSRNAVPCGTPFFQNRSRPSRTSRSSVTTSPTPNGSPYSSHLHPDLADEILPVLLYAHEPGTAPRLCAVASNAVPPAVVPTTSATPMANPAPASTCSSRTEQMKRPITACSLMPRWLKNAVRHTSRVVTTVLLSDSTMPAPCSVSLNVYCDARPPGASARTAAAATPAPPPAPPEAAVAAVAAAAGVAAPPVGMPAMGPPPSPASGDVATAPRPRAPAAPPSPAEPVRMPANPAATPMPARLPYPRSVMAGGSAAAPAVSVRAEAARRAGRAVTGMPGSTLRPACSRERMAAGSAVPDGHTASECRSGNTSAAMRMTSPHVTAPPSVPATPGSATTGMAAARPHGVRTCTNVHPAGTGGAASGAGRPVVAFVGRTAGRVREGTGRGGPPAASTARRAARARGAGRAAGCGASIHASSSLTCGG